MCNDPFGYMTESGDLVAPSDVETLCNDRHYRDKHGVPDDKTSTMCRKMTQYGNKYILGIFINHNTISMNRLIKYNFLQTYFSQWRAYGN